MRGIPTVHQVVLRDDGVCINEDPTPHNPQFVVEHQGRWATVLGDVDIEGLHCAVSVPTDVMSREQFEAAVRAFWSGLEACADAEDKGLFPRKKPA